MSANNIPCRNPEICKVKTHHPGTDPLCRQGKKAYLPPVPSDMISKLSKTPSLNGSDTPTLSDLAQKAVDNEPFAQDYFTNNMIGQYLDQIADGTPVSELEDVTDTDHNTADDELELVFELSHQEIEDLTDEQLEGYEAALIELGDVGQVQAKKFVQSKAGTPEFARMERSRALYREDVEDQGNSGYMLHNIQIDWAERPLKWISQQEISESEIRYYGQRMQ